MHSLKCRRGRFQDTHCNDLAQNEHLNYPVPVVKQSEFYVPSLTPTQDQAHAMLVSFSSLTKTSEFSMTWPRHLKLHRLKQVNL